jgi:DNA-binding transcriptional ArsR family regulator
MSAAVVEADVFVAIANPVRRDLLDALRAGSLPVHELAGGFEISRPAVSQHLAVLLTARLVTEERVGRQRRYRAKTATTNGQACVQLLGARADHLVG